MNDEFVRNARSNGEEGWLWLKQIPSIIKECEEKWDIQVAAPFHLSYNYVAPAVRADSSQAVLKIGFPKDREFQTEMEALSIFDGRGAVKLLESDRANAVILIERAVPGTPVSALDDDEAATRIMASVMRQLWKPLPKNYSLIPITERVSAIAEYQERFKDKTGPLPKDLVDKAEKLCRQLIATSVAPVLVHGDLHQDNVLRSERDDWLAIDPKGIAAEPAYEVGAMMGNPYMRMKDRRDLPEILRRRILILSEELGTTAKRILEWSFVHAVLSGAWRSVVEGTKRPEHVIRVAEALNRISV